MCTQALLRVFMLVGGIFGSGPKKIRKRKEGVELAYPMPCVCAMVEQAVLLPALGLTCLSPGIAESSLAW